MDAKQNDSSDSIFFEGQYCYCDVLRVIKALRVIGGDRRSEGHRRLVSFLQMGFFEMGHVLESKFALVRSVVMCGLWWVCRLMFRGCFRNSFLGHSSSHSVLVRPMNSWGLGRYPLFHIKTGVGCGR